MNILFTPTTQMLAMTEGAGGLFDFNLTLPLIAIQFILLTIVLNIINMVESKIILYMCHSKYSKY